MTNAQRVPRPQCNWIASASSGHGGPIDKGPIRAFGVLKHETRRGNLNHGMKLRNARVFHDNIIILCPTDGDEWKGTSGCFSNRQNAQLHI